MLFNLKRILSTKMWFPIVLFSQLLELVGTIRLAVNTFVKKVKKSEKENLLFCVVL